MIQARKNDSTIGVANRQTLNEIEALPLLRRQRQAQAEAGRVEAERARAERANRLAVNGGSPSQSAGPERSLGIRP